MGVNNKQRRAAKKKARQRPRPAEAQECFVPEPTPELARHYVLDALAVVDADPATAPLVAQRLVRPDGPVPPSMTRRALGELLAGFIARVVAQGWRPTDLVQVVRRRGSEARVPLLLGLVAAEGDRHPQDRVAAAWRDDLDAGGVREALRLDDVAHVQGALELCICLAVLPPLAVLLPPPGTAPESQVSGDSGDPKLLARVRALLAKAESTEYDEEAEALSAKAQELISRHALERLLAETSSPHAGTTRSHPAAARRIWIDTPYVFAKAMLVTAVADANRCRSVVSEKLGFCTVIGQEADLVSVDVLVTSLLVQASTAMRRHGRQTDRTGTSRTKSFRQSFLVSYASRIGERLQAAADEAVQSTGRSGDLVPVLRLRAEQVDAARDAMFPHLVTREASIGNAQGWAAGRAAADLARLDTDLQLRSAAS